jgi:anti-sigma factor ChrR (cupin superfamily)
MFDPASLEWRQTRYEGISLHVLRRDHQTGDATLFIRMEPGCGYPAHSHRGVEEVLILQGGYADATGEHRAGDYVVNEAGSAHHPVALDGPEACIMLAVTHGGIELLKRGESLKRGTQADEG